LEHAPGQEVQGDLKFEKLADGVRVSGMIEASPGVHGFHVHEKGDCSDIPGKSMGNHFAPDGHIHALPTETSERHLGDMGNVVVEANGKGKIDFVIVGATLTASDAHSLLGKAVVLHAAQDSGKAEQPAGDSGVPIACGIIKLAS
jgi:superoxide dismutase, Cu-Zn family